MSNALSGLSRTINMLARQVVWTQKFGRRESLPLCPPLARELNPSSTQKLTACVDVISHRFQFYILFGGPSQSFRLRRSYFSITAVWLFNERTLYLHIDLPVARFFRARLGCSGVRLSIGQSHCKYLSNSHFSYWLPTMQSLRL